MFIFVGENSVGVAPARWVEEINGVRLDAVHTHTRDIPIVQKKYMINILKTLLFIFP